MGLAPSLNMQRIVAILNAGRSSATVNPTNAVAMGDLPSMNQAADKMLTTEELAQVLQVPVSTVKTMYRTKRIPHLKLGHRTVRFDLPAVVAALARGLQTEER